MMSLSILKSTLRIAVPSRGHEIGPESSSCWYESRSTVENSRSPGVGSAIAFSCPCSRNIPLQRGQVWTFAWPTGFNSRGCGITRTVHGTSRSTAAKYDAKSKTPEARCLGRFRTPLVFHLPAVAADVIDAGDVENSATNPLSAQFHVFAGAKTAERAAVDVSGDDAAGCIVAQPDRSGAVVDAVD